MANSVPFLLPVKKDEALSALLSESLRRSSKTRDQVARELSIALNRRITVHMLNQYVAPSKIGMQMPIAYIDAFCSVLGDDSLKRFLLGPQLSRMLTLGETVARVLPDALASADASEPDRTEAEAIALQQ